MAANTPVVYMPKDAESGIVLDLPLWFLTDPYSGAGSLSYRRLQIATSAAFSTIVLDTLLRAADQLDMLTDGFEVHLALAEIQVSGTGRVGFLPSTTYHYRTMAENSLAEESAWSTTRTFTTAAATVSKATYLQGF